MAAGDAWGSVQPKFRAAVVQAGSIPLDTPATLQKLRRLAAEAAEGGAELVVFPEAFVGGYPKGQEFGVTIGRRTDQGRDQFRDYWNCAIELPGPEAELLAATAREYGIYLVTGVIERNGGTLYCTALVFGSDGQLLGTHRKVMPTAMERVIWGSGDGSTLPVVSTKLGRLGVVICWENYMPLLRAAMYAKGIELYCAITVDDRETWQSTIQHIALEGRCFVLSACQFLGANEGRHERPDSNGSSQTALIRGGSAIIGPLGQQLAGPVWETECIVFADLDREELARSKFDFDPVGHYSRPDLFQLKVNEEPMRPVVFQRTQA
jgi:nitrilase